MLQSSLCDTIAQRNMTASPVEHAPEVDNPKQRTRRWAVRRRRDRLVAGLASGLADHWGIPVPYVRAGFVVAAFAGGAGIAVYVIGWIFTLDRQDDDPEADPKTPAQKAGLAFIVLGALLALRGFNLWFGDGIVFAASLLSFGIATMWDRSDPVARSRIAKLTGSGEDDVTRIRVIGGGLLMLAGFASFVGSIDAFSDVGPALFAAAVTITGFMIVFGPLVWRLATDLGRERRGRIRSEERADMAAHLHDSVLQTLALIQRTDDPKRMITLARGQERELRGWLYRDKEASTADDLGSAIRAHAGRVEASHDLPIEVVVVGDEAPMTTSLHALAQAAGEAMTNAAKHSGSDRVSVYVEIDAAQAEIYVIDDGRGFDPAAIPKEGRGIAESIAARMQRHGGTAAINSSPGNGAELRLTMGRN